MSLVIDLLILAIVIPGAALLGHLFVAYYIAPTRAKASILEALSTDKEFQGELMKSLLHALFSPTKGKDPSGNEISVIPIDVMISRAKAEFETLVKRETAKLGNVANMSKEEIESMDPLEGLITSLAPKNLKIPVLMGYKILGNKKKPSGSTNTTIAENPWE